jgi:crotonobetainyl-CoA:carnitine CoA-transferase CaiB-like acyl-CoA transferase
VQARGPLAGVRVIESSMLGPAEVGALLADLGADVIKVEPPGGDYGRQTTWPIIRLSTGDGDASLLWLHVNRGKRSIVLDLRHADAVAVFLELARGADVVVEAMRPGALARRGLDVDRLWSVNRRLVFCSLSGYGATGPYRNLPSHGIAFDSWAGQVPVARTEDGQPYIPEHTSIGIHAGPMLAALAIVAAVLEAQRTGVGRAIELAQSDAAAYFDWYRIESWRSYERPQDEVYGNAADGGARRPPGTAGMRDGVRYQFYDTADGVVLFMASEQAFWRAFCEAVGRPDLYARWPGSPYADHAPGNRELRAELAEVFATKTAEEWIAFGQAHDLPIAPVHTPKTIAADPQFRHRLPWIPKEQLEADMLPFPLHHLDGSRLPTPRRAPRAGEHTEEILRDVLGCTPDEVAALRRSGAVG